MYRDLKSRLQLYKMGAGCGGQRMTKTGSDIQDLIEGIFAAMTMAPVLLLKTGTLFPTSTEDAGWGMRSV